MKSLLTGTVAAFVLGAAIASSQTPTPGQTPSTPPAGGQAQPRGDTTTPRGDTQRSTTAKPQTQTYKGYLRGSASSGWTISPMDSRTGATSTAGGAAGTSPTTYSVVAGDASKVKFDSMADKCVEIVGMLAPESGMSSPGAGGAANNPGAGAAGNAPGGAAQAGAAVGGEQAAGVAAGGGARMSASSMHRTLTVTSIKTAQGCKP